MLTAVLAATAVPTGRPARAAELPLPAGAEHLLAHIAGACPECAAIGYVPCGTPAIAWGRGFRRSAHQGTPSRAYLVGFTMTGEAFRARARRTPYPELLAALRDRFGRSRLVVLERGFERVRVLGPPRDTTVTFPAALHACVHASDLPWACCAGDCGRECCEKRLGSPGVALTWQDGDETIVFHYRHTIGDSWLDRRRPERRVRYACLTDARGTLRPSASE